ncbi:MAG: glycosyltransferase family 39 protein [Deltaproteobacteria bacterium]|nr:glycosyltransferase family 39 protein [Deltaproteobacteria bacterium]
MTVIPGFPKVVQNSILIGLGAVAAFFNVTHEPLWLDESYSAIMSAHTPMDIWHFAKTDVHPPLYYIVLHAVTTFGGQTEFFYRLPSVLFALGILMCGIWPAARLYGRTTAVLFSALVITAPSILCFAQEARMYTMMAFFVFAFFVYGLLAARDGGKRDFVLFFLALTGAMYTHYYGLLAAAVFVIYLLIFAHVSHPQRAVPLWTCVILSVLAYVPWLPSLWHQVTRVASGFWIPKADSFILKFAWMMPFSFKFEDIPWPWWSLVAMLLALALIGFGIYRSFSSKQGQFFKWLPMLVYLTTFVIAVLLSWTVEPVLMPRYMMFGVPLFFLSVAIGINSLSRQWHQLVATSLLLLFMVPTDIIIYRNRFNGPFHEISDRIQSVPDNTAPLVHEDWQTLLPLRILFPNRTHLFIVPEGEAPRFDVFYGPNPPKVVRTFKEVFQFSSHAWFIDSNLMPIISLDTFKKDSVFTVVPAKKFAPPYAFVHPTVCYATQSLTLRE